MDLMMEEALLRCKKKIGRWESEKKMWMKVWLSGLLKQSFMVMEMATVGRRAPPWLLFMVGIGMARSIEEAIVFDRVLDEAGVVIARSHGFSKKID
ncbi:hypothetical protein Ddye_013533 [Dipteronia dyeriana]|uniref:Uncharacterized protein n=1 Tax=Dipteronia dyeriana TaxID=168575 RepID=A0AAD9X6L4_9ROSI|nr:hypothetical protein Ddye_013533 [Dipteronia dyeriana]